MILVEAEGTVIDAEQIAVVCKWEALYPLADNEADVKGEVNAFLVILKSGAVLCFGDRAERERILSAWEQAAAIIRG